jgi:DNA polymerase III subunit alpha
MPASFCHLHVHSQYSILDSSLSVSAIASAAKQFGMPAAALTDHGNLYGAIDFYKAMKEAGLHSIIGCEVNIIDGSRFEKKKAAPPSHLVLLAKDTKGYKNLCKISSAGFTEGFYYVPRIDFELLANFSEGLICLTGCEKGPLAQAAIKGDDKEVERRINQLLQIFGKNLYFEIQRHRTSQEDMEFDGMARENWLYRQYQDHIAMQSCIEQVLRKEGEKRGIPCVATNNCHYLKRDDWRAHEVLLNIQSGEPCLLRQKNPHTDQTIISPNPKRETFPTHEYHFKSPEEMAALFADFPEALAVTADIAEQCHVEIDFVTKHYPVFSISSTGDQAPSAEQFLRTMCQEAISVRYTEDRLQKVSAQYPGQDPKEVVEKRLAYELEIITSKGLTDYFLLVWDFISWAKKRGIPVGPGRGSAVGSIVSYLIRITEIEPLSLNLFFERFINPGRMSYPDIDVDLCMERRSEVIAYIAEKYGKESVAQIITFGTMKAKMSVRDVGRALNVPLPKVNQLAKLIPDDLNITIEQALEKDHDLRAFVEKDEEANSIIEAAKVLQGSIRNTGIHAAGIIICGDSVVNHIPICTAKDSDMFATQYSMKPAEQVGMLKVDFLGLKTLTILNLCAKFVKSSHHLDIDWCNLPTDDEGAFKLLNQGHTLGVFQIENGGMQDLARQLHLDKFEEIVALLSLYRPGPMEMIPTFIARKCGREPVEYDHPLIEPILKETYGVMVYQEQIMQIASQLADYTLGEGDVLRRAMGKKDAKEMARQRAKFIEGAMKKDISEAVATSIFDKMEKFAEYGFNKSHAAAYGYLTYATAYFKSHFPSEWLAALMTGDRDDIEKVAKTMHEARQMHIACLPPDINESDDYFKAAAKGIRFALSAVKGVGTSAVQAIVDERSVQPFSSLYDFVRRIDAKRIGRKTIELLIDAGSFDQFSWTRDELQATLDVMYDDVQRSKKERERGVLNLFDPDSTDTPKAYRSPAAPSRIRTQEELLFREKQLLGLFVSGHPLTMYEGSLKSLCCLAIRDALDLPSNSVFRMAFVVEKVEIKISTKSQRKFAILNISDASGDTFEMPIWSDLYEAQHEILQENSLLWGVFSKELRNNETSISCRFLAEVKNITQPVIEQSYAAYEKARSQLHISRHSSSKKGSLAQAKQPKAEAPLITVFLNLRSFRASHALTLASVVSSKQGGTDRIQIAFMREDRVASTLQLPPAIFSPEMQQAIEELPCWLSMQQNSSER